MASNTERVKTDLSRAAESVRARALAVARALPACARSESHRAERSARAQANNKMHEAKGGADVHASNAGSKISQARARRASDDAASRGARAESAAPLRRWRTTPKKASPAVCTRWARRST
jgi:hypothetical protein